MEIHLHLQESSATQDNVGVNPGQNMHMSANRPSHVYYTIDPEAYESMLQSGFSASLQP